MGTDIHGVFQRRDSATGRWRDIASQYDEDRDYQLFAVLAGVRNGTGFAAVKTGEVVRPIAQPRGLPADFVMANDSHPVESTDHLPPWRRRHHKEGEPLNVWLGDHSHSWVLGSEILAWAEKAPTVLKTGVLDRDVYTAWDGASNPSSYCGNVIGRDVLIVNDNAVEMERNPTFTHVRCHWSSDLRDELAYFFDEVARLVTEHGDVRFVFGFDS